MKKNMGYKIVNVLIGIMITINVIFVLRACIVRILNVTKARAISARIDIICDPNIVADKRMAAAEYLVKKDWYRFAPIQQKVAFEIASQEWQLCINEGAVAAPVLCQFLKTGDSNIQKCLVQIGSSSVPPLIAMLAGDDQKINSVIVDILVQIGQPSVLPLMTVIKSKDSMLLPYAADALVQIGQPSVWPLYEMLKENNDPNRRIATEVLLRMGQPAIESLITELKDDNGVTANDNYILPIPVDLVYIPGGTFQMGDSISSEGYSHEHPVHMVTLSPFYMGKYEITNGQYCIFLNSAKSQGLITVISNIVYQAGSETRYPYCDTYQSSTHSQINWDGSTFSVRTKSGRSMGNDPMATVSWYGAVDYCNWQSQQEGKQACYNLTTWEWDISKKGYHLPTEAQWEYAARGGLSGKRFPWGDTITHNQANYDSSDSLSYDISSARGCHPTWNHGGSPYTSPVGSFAANGFGLYDMAGNVYEWCNDWFGSSYYNSSPNSDPTGSTTGTYRVLRGGGWDINAIHCRVAYRNYNIPYILFYHYGFRISLDY